MKRSEIEIETEAESWLKTRQWGNWRPPDTSCRAANAHRQTASKRLQAPPSPFEHQLVIRANKC